MKVIIVWKVAPAKCLERRRVCHDIAANFDFKESLEFAFSNTYYKGHNHQVTHVQYFITMA